MPYASSAGYRKHSQIRSRLPTYEEPPRLLFMEGEERMWAPEDGKAKAGYLALTLLAILGLVRNCSSQNITLNFQARGELARV